MIKEITFIINTWGDAHQMSRVFNFDKRIDKVNILTYVRNYYPTKSERTRKILGHIEHGNYTKRIFIYFKTLMYHVYSIKKDETYYVFGLDNLFVLKIASAIRLKKINIIYEVSDLRPITFVKNHFGKLVRFIDNYLLESVKLVVFTSPGFLKYYSVNRAIKLNYFILENKVHLEPKSFQNKKELITKSDIITIGYFGLLRCSQSLEILIKLSQNHQHIKVILRGIFIDGTEWFEKRIKALSHINYLGPYSSPSDLGLIYSKIDVSWIAYPFSHQTEGNWKYAMTNRFYEAGFFGIPMVASKGTRDAQKVIENKVGIEIDLSDTLAASRVLSKYLKHKNLTLWSGNFKNIETMEFCMTNEYDQLISIIYKQKR